MKLVATLRPRIPHAALAGRLAPSPIRPVCLQDQRQLWRDLFIHSYSSSSSSTASPSGFDDGQRRSIDGNKVCPHKVEIMSSQGPHRRITRSSASFDPNAQAFAPAPDGYNQSPSHAWQTGHVPRHRNQGHPDSAFAGGNAPQGLLGNYPVFQQQTRHFNSMPAGGRSLPVRSGHQPSPTFQSAGPTRDPEIAGIDSDASSSPSVGDPLPQLTPDQIQTVTIPILGKSSKMKKARTTDKKRPYVKPSKASGGVPNPSKEYITQSARAPSVLPQPRQILIIIDLNGTLLHRPDHKKSASFVERPFTRQFLDYCLKTFTVAIWSSARPDNVRRMVPQILSAEEQQKLVAIWGRDTLGLSPEDYNQRVQCYKRLESIWNDPRVAASHPEAQHGKRWDQTNTVLIDDSKEKSRSQPYNIIQLPEFEGDTTEPGYVLPQVHNYLNECAIQQDISSFIRENPFKFNPEFQLGALQSQPEGTA